MLEKPGAFVTAVLGILTTAIAAAQPPQAWLERYDGPAGGFDIPGAGIDVDSLGDVVVAGLVNIPTQPNASEPRMITIKFAPDGTQRWVNVHPGPGGSFVGAMAVAADDHILIAGSAESGSHWGIIKYAPNGSVVWSRLYVESLSAGDTLRDVAVDAGGSVFVVGTDLCPGPSSCSTLAKYDAAGTQQWVRTWQSGTNNSFPRKLATDTAGNVYVAGSAIVSGLSNEMILLKYDAAGTLEWDRSHGLAGQFTSDDANDVAVDRAGNVIIAGAVGGNTAAFSDVEVRKYDPAGDLIWSHTYDGPNASGEIGRYLAIDSHNNVLVAGTIRSQVQSDALLLKISAGGALLWERFLDGDYAFEDSAAGVRADAQDNVYLAASLSQFAARDSFGVQKYDPGGTPIWLALHTGPSSDPTYSFGVALAADNSVYTTGRMPGAGFFNSSDIVTIKYAQSPAAAPGDIDGDGDVDLIDLELFLSVFGTLGGDPAFNAAADFDSSGCVDLGDLALLQAHFGT